MLSAVESVLDHKRRFEWLFAAAVFSNVETAKRDYGWIEPNVFSDLGVAAFWAGILENKAEAKAAIDAGILDRLLAVLSDNEGLYLSTRLSECAAVISEDAYLVHLAEDNSTLARLINQRKIDEARELILSMSDRAPARVREYPTVTDGVLELMSAIEDGVGDIIHTGLSSLDRAIGGLERQTLTLIAARPSVGKTAFGLQISANIALGGKRVIYFSPEMGQRLLVARMVCGSVGVMWRDVISNRLSNDKKAQLKAAANELVDLMQDRLYVIDDAVITNADIWRAVADIRPAVFVVDHTALVTHKSDSEHLRLGVVTWNGKQAAKEFDCAAVYLQQLSRRLTQRDNKRPTLTDLEGSGKLEQNADNVIFLHREDYYDLEEAKNEISDTELWIDKNRMGLRGIKVNLKYNLTTQKFYPVERN